MPCYYAEDDEPNPKHGICIHPCTPMEATGHIGITRDDRIEPVTWVCKFTDEDKSVHRIKGILYCPFCGEWLGVREDWMSNLQREIMGLEPLFLPVKGG